MSELDIINEWLQIAYDDYDSARFLYENKIPKPLEIICYHCQQSAEKSLKAYLCANDIDIPKTHEVKRICVQCSEVDGSFSVFFFDCEELEVYATETRYPIRIEIDDTHAKRALWQASRIYEFVSRKIALLKTSEAECLENRMISVRMAQVQDIDRISLVLATSWRTAYRGIVDDDYLDALRDDHWIEFLTSALNGDSIFSMVLLDNQEIIGASILGKSETENEIQMISFYLLPENIGQGFGQTFYSEIEKEMRNKGFTTCVVDVLENNKRAIRFYEAHGFVDMHVKEDVTLGKRSYPLRVFKKTLS